MTLSSLFQLFLQSVSPQKGGEVNLTLGGIDLNSSGRYVLPVFVVYKNTSKFSSMY